MGQHPGRRAEPSGHTPAGMGELRWHLELPESTSPSGHSSWVLRMLLVPLTIQGAEEQRAFGIGKGGQGLSKPSFFPRGCLLVCAQGISILSACEMVKSEKENNIKKIK